MLLHFKPVFYIISIIHSFISPKLGRSHNPLLIVIFHKFHNFSFFFKFSSKDIVAFIYSKYNNTKLFYHTEKMILHFLLCRGKVRWIEMKLWKKSRFFQENNWFQNLECFFVKIFFCHFLCHKKGWTFLDVCLYSTYLIFIHLLFTFLDV